MMDINEIKRISKEASVEARQNKTELFIAQTNGDINIKNAPFIGSDYIPNGWEKTENLYFVDASGLGSESEPALTFTTFLTKVKKDFGYGIVEAGQFQVYIQEFKKIDARELWLEAKRENKQKYYNNISD